MPKRIALKDSVEVDSVDLSNFARAVTLTSEHAREGVSGFSATGANEYLAGATDQSVDVEFYGSYGTGEVHETLYPIHKDREVVAFAWRPDQTAPASATNPELRGNVQLYTYSPGGTRGDVDTFTVTFNAADEDGLAFFTTPSPEVPSARGSTLQVQDFQKFMITLANTDKAMARSARAEIRRAGDHVRDDARTRFERYDSRSAAGYRVVVRRRGVAVEQKLRRTTGQHPEFGKLQMVKALAPAADENEDKTRAAIEAAYDVIAARFNR